MSIENKLHSKPKNRRWLWALPILAMLIVVSAFWIIDRQQDIPQNLYTAAVADAVTADADEIEPLVELTTDSPLTTWDKQGRVLLLSWHRHPERYTAGEEITRQTAQSGHLPTRKSPHGMKKTKTASPIGTCVWNSSSACHPRRVIPM